VAVTEPIAPAKILIVNKAVARGFKLKTDAHMILAQTAFIRRPRGIQLLVAAMLLSAALTVPAGADPKSDTFQPDAFRTGAALRQRMPGLTDPLGRECPLPPSALSLTAAVDIALCRNPTTRSAWASAHLQAAALGSAESAWLPTITASDSESRAYGKHVDVTGNEVDTPQNTNDAALTLSWTLYDFGLRSGKIHSARYLLDAGAETATSTVQQTVFNVVQDYYGVVAGDAALAAAQLTEETDARSVEAARALHEGGAAALGDVLQAETAYDQAVLARVQAGQSAVSARGTLAVVIGVTADQPLKVDSVSVPTQVPALTARMADLMAEAARQRPDLASARSQVDAAVSDITVARAVGRPSIAISGGRDRIDTAGIPLQNFSQIGVTLTVPIFTGFSVGYGVRQAQSTLEIREANAEQIRLQVTLDVWNGYNALESAIKQLEGTATLTKTAQTNEEVALGRYKAGVGTILDLLTAQTAVAAALQARISAEHSWEVSRAQLVLALGRLSGAEPLNSSAALP
jgi:outer membrane protein